jgi:hypothetical protein
MLAESSAHCLFSALISRALRLMVRDRAASRDQITEAAGAPRGPMIA